MDNYLDSTRKVIDENFDDSRLIDFELLRKNIMVPLLRDALLIGGGNQKRNSNRDAAVRLPEEWPLCIQDNAAACITSCGHSGHIYGSFDT